MVLKDKIFSLFSNYDKRVDVNKDESNKGTLQRYNEMLADDMDVEIIPLIKNILENTLIPTTALQKYIPYLESIYGINFVISTDWEIRRKFLGFIVKYNQVKGTKLGYKYPMYLLGITDIIFDEVWIQYSFDSPTTFDDAKRRFDMKCNPCSDYSLDIIGATSMNPEKYQSILNIIKYNEPINAKLTGLTFNGGAFVTSTISITIDSNGDLIYNNDYDPGLILTIDSNGNLLVDGPMKNHYSINASGDLIFTI